MKTNIQAFVILLASMLVLSSCKVGRFVAYNFADIHDYKKFPYRTIENGPSTFEFSRVGEEKNAKTLRVNNQNHVLEDYLEDHKTVSFLIIQNDTLRYERYFGKYAEASVVPSFSMAKSIVSILLGCAIDDGFITSVDEPVTHYIPELKENGFEQVHLAHLLQMTSGLNFNESYFNPFGHAASFYYGTNLRKAIRKLKLKSEPGKVMEYASGNSQLLGLVIERSLKGKSLSEYLEEKLWKPLGMEYDATWSVDRKKEGLEKTFCCVNARAVDFAKIGRLYLNKGNWNGKQIVSKDWVARSTQVDTTEGSATYYQYQWWIPNQKGDFMARGILGQYIYVNPAKNIIIVRLGKKEGGTNWTKIFESLAQEY